MNKLWRQVVVVLLSCVAAGGGWCIYKAIYAADRSERALHACILATDLLEQYVDATIGRWPRSWDDLEASVATARFDAMYRWPQDRKKVERCVQIDFSANPESLARQSVDELDVITPIGPCYSTYKRHFSFLIEALHRHHQGNQGDSDGRSP